MKKRRSASSDFENGSRVTLSGLATAVVAFGLLLAVGIADAARQAWVDWYVQPNRC